MDPIDPNEPLPTTPVAAGTSAQPPHAASAPPPTAPPSAGWGAPPPGWGGWGPPPWMAPPTPPRRDRLALAIVAFIFGGIFLVFFGFLMLAYGAVRGESPRLGSGPRIGVIELKGPIGMGGPDGVDSQRVLKQLRRFERDDAIKAIVLRVDSPGGAVGPSQEIYDEVKKVAARKTVVCSMGTVAASGGFYISMGCPKGNIVALPGTITGSIGVISQFPNLSKLAQRFDFKMETVKSGALKDAGNPFRDMTPEDRAYWQGLIDRIYGQFLGAVVESRGLPEEKVRRVADGRVLTGADALEAGLVDKLGNINAAVDHAMKVAKLTGEPELVYPPDDRGRLLEELMGGMAGAAARAVKAELASGATASTEPGLYFLPR